LIVDANKAIATKNQGSPQNASGSHQKVVSVSEHLSDELSSILWGEEEVAKPEEASEG